MTKVKQIIFSVMILGLGIVMLNNTLFSLPETQCSCLNFDAAESYCTTYCAGLGSTCMTATRTVSECSVEGCWSRYLVICESGTSTYYNNTVDCPQCMID